MAASFGRRQVQAAAAPRVSMAVAPPVETAAPVVRAAAPARTPPLVTIGLLVLLTLVFMWEVRASPVLHPGYAPPVGALVGFGAIDGALVRDGGWWRILTAPLLHANLSHLISNGVVLAVIGFMLEPLVGPRWFAALYAAGAVGGSLCSILLNAPDIPAVGASGAIMGVLAGAFLCGSSARAGPKGRRMQTWALRLMLPALIPLAANSHVDYAGHLGGAVAGLAMGVILQMAWPRGAERPDFGPMAAGIGAVVVSCGVLALVLVPHKAAIAAAAPSGLIPDEALPALSDVTSDRARALLERYPRDPRAHLMRGFAFLKDDHDLADAEEQFREALAAKDLAAAGLDAGFGKTVTVLLALTVAYEHRPDEARALGGPLCGFADENLPEITDNLREQHVCDG